MSAPILIDSLAFAQDQQQLNGEIAIAALSRVVSELVSSEGVITWSLCGRIDALSRPVLHLNIEGIVILECQRCLNPMPHTLDCTASITLFPSDAELESACEIDDTLDAIVAPSEPLNVEALIEDEILLSLPLSPRHDVCQGVRNEPAATQTQPNPFAALAQLKTHQPH